MHRLSDRLRGAGSKEEKMNRMGRTSPPGGGAAATAPYVCIYASQVAMCIGANKHKKISEALELMWQRVAPGAFQAAMRRHGMKTEDELAADIIRSHVEVRELVDLTLASPCQSSDQVAEQYDTVAKELRAVPMPEEDRKLVDDVLKRNLYTSYGNTHETSVLGYIRDTLGIECRDDPTFYKHHQGACAGPWGAFPWFVGGKIDAIDAEHTLLIEIKNRVNRLFYRIPFYEQVQVQAYLHLLGLERGVLVECLKTRTARAAQGAPGEDCGDRAVPPGDREAAPGDREAAPGDREAAPAALPSMTVNVIPIHRNRDLWDQEIVPKLEGFVDFLAHIMHDAALQDRYLQSKRRSAMVTSHINNWLKLRKAR